MTDDGQFIFETYKLHTELAERVASLRESLNKIYSGMVTSIVAASVLLYRLLPDGEDVWVWVWVLPVLGILMSLTWMLSLHSVTGRLSAKHNVLLDLEKEFPFKFLDKENDLFIKGRFLRRKYSGMVMPGGFLILSGAWLSVLLIQNYCPT